MKNSKISPSRLSNSTALRGFTLMETVIAIGVLAILLTGFLAVFTPAAQGIRRSISSQQANRLTSTLERELVTLRKNQPPTGVNTGFEKAYDWIENGNDAGTAIFLYQYRGDPANLRGDGTPEPLDKVEGQPGENYIVQSIARRADDPELGKDLKALDGAIFYVKPTQLVYSGNKMILGTPGEIKHLANGSLESSSSASDYKDAVIAFAAEFHSVPSKAIQYLTGPPFQERFSSAKNPVFTRNLAVRR